MDLANSYERFREGVGRLLLGDGLRAKATRGGAWVGGASVAEQASRFARNMILTRLLAPNAFGAMAIVMSSSAIVGTLIDVGQKAAVVQNPRGGEKAYLNAAWWMGMGRAVATYFVIFAMAPWVSRFYRNSELSVLLQVTLLGTLFEGAMSPRSILPQKEMKFGRWAAISNGGAICGVILTVILSFALRSVWALAIGFCSENAFRCLFSYIICPGLPSLGWDRRAARDLLKFSRGIFGLSFMTLILGRTDIFVLGKLYSATALGLYTMAVFLVQTPSSFITNALGQTLLPAFSHVQEDRERINRILLEVTSWLIMLGLPVVVVICLCGPSLLRVLYGVRYVAAAGPLAVASAVVFFTILNAVITCTLVGVGRPALHRLAVAASAATMLIAIYPACKLLGAVGGQVAALVAIVINYVLQVIFIRRLTGLDVLRYGKAFAPAVLVSFGLLCVGLGARFLGFATRPLASIALGGGACIVAYALCLPAYLRMKQAA
jgi:O-antigen/teichoic acid export membrane protein